MKKGYSVFGKAYEIMNKNDLHDIDSIDHRFMQEMILLDESSYDYLYNKEVNYYDMTHHELFDFSKQFKGNSIPKEERMISVQWMDIDEFLKKCTHENVKDIVNEI